MRKLFDKSFSFPYFAFLFIYLQMRGVIPRKVQNQLNNEIT